MKEPACDKGLLCTRFISGLYFILIATKLGRYFHFLFREDQSKAQYRVASKNAVSVGLGDSLPKLPLLQKRMRRKATACVRIKRSHPHKQSPVPGIKCVFDQYELPSLFYLTSTYYVLGTLTCLKSFHHQDSPMRWDPYRPTDGSGGTERLSESPKVTQLGK